MIIKMTQQLIDNSLQTYASARRVELVSDDRSGLYIELRDTNKTEGTLLTLQR